MKGENRAKRKSGGRTAPEKRRYRLRASDYGEFLSVGDLEKILGICDGSIRKMLQRGILPGLWIARKWRVPRGVFEQWLSDRLGARYDGTSDGVTDESDGPSGGVAEGGHREGSEGVPTGGEGEAISRR